MCDALHATETRERTIQIGYRGTSPTRISTRVIVPASPTAIEVARLRAGDAIDLGVVVTHPLAIIDRIHLVGPLPTIPIKNSYSPSVPSAGGFVSRRGIPKSLDVNTHRDFARSAMLTFVHEIGHFLDLAALGTAGAFSTLAGDALLDGWRNAVEATLAVQTLRHRIGAGSVVIQTPHGPVEETVGDRHVAYLLGYDELWARSYAQYVAERSMDATLMDALDLTRTPAPLGQLYPAQWGTDDFAPVAKAIDTLFRELGWLL